YLHRRNQDQSILYPVHYYGLIPARLLLTHRPSRSHGHCPILLVWIHAMPICHYITSWQKFYWKRLLSDDNGLYPISIVCHFSVHSQNKIRENLRHTLLIRYRIAYFTQNLDYIFHQFHRQKFHPRSLSIFFWVLNDHSEYLYSHRESKCLLMQGFLIPYRNTLQFFYLQYNV